MITFREELEQRIGSKPDIEQLRNLVTSLFMEAHPLFDQHTTILSANPLFSSMMTFSALCLEAKESLDRLALPAVEIQKIVEAQELLTKQKHYSDIEPLVQQMLERAYTSIELRKLITRLHPLTVKQKNGLCSQLIDLKVRTLFEEFVNLAEVTKNAKDEEKERLIELLKKSNIVLFHQFQDDNRLLRLLDRIMKEACDENENPI